MPVGLQIFDAAGNVVFDTSDRILKVRGVIDTGTADGSISDPYLIGKTILFYKAAPFSRFFNAHSAAITTDNVAGTISWSFSGPVGGRISSKLVYAVV